MGTIVDILTLEPRELCVFQAKYPHFEILNNTLSGLSTRQKIVISIQEEDEDSYYDFLLLNYIALSSKEFTHRLSHDKLFAERIKTRAEILFENAHD
ncbi:hypothetical protein [Geomonas oryzae]|jgi:hypothetical protein|uniref:hypothetical protein n=1 Tax=Geomonas oryzae TaxID=2364273 RepID=UPI00100B054C|nr:hypothetical protein [Geomonas oryzae]